jgi:hypothetical protein
LAPPPTNEIGTHRRLDRLRRRASAPIRKTLRSVQGRDYAGGYTGRGSAARIGQRGTHSIGKCSTTARRRTYASPGDFRASNLRGGKRQM